ncbi:SusC/RagA family TonB-linked outer membrane protein [Dinghuibacter silviterrae]|uniref:TonB-linked SusC/RagA family outer membrane protein n=1 Tax=Dinghuibacter silviterrae TaxID=1539049 RepID=A0A4R8DE56_9BACT|nr:SusC/RagA family TonB-linked outer membrane protein [Dinghuibacter silviterrae]TDW95803.1 TonB-linked SusC/RagA family outer membrane protein [Dinghuibacter silviterrae]
MSKVLTALLVFLFAYSAQAQEGTRKITGKVQEDGSNSPLPAATIQVKNKKIAAITNPNGQFTVTVPEGTVVLEVSSVGYVTKEVTVDGSMEFLTISLALDSKTLSNVVVTALGVRKTEKSVTYSTQQVSGGELTRVRTDNLMDALDGKVAGVTISPSSSGVGGSAKVILRGSRSAAGGNQPLYVIDGIPISNASNSNMQPNSTYGGATNVDGGDGISNLNPDDIESITILKGASASALYGSQAANGVIVITTKKGRVGHTQIQFSSLASMDNIAYKPKFQDGYGQTSAGATTSWGSKLSSGASDNLKDFFQTGDNFTNSISLSGGSDLAQTYFSYANTTARGVEPGNKLTRNNFNFRETGHFLNNRLTVDANISYITQEINNTPGMGLYFNPLTGLYLFPRGVDITPYKNNYEGAVGSNGAPTQNWPFNEDVQQNPWWIIHRNPNDGKRNRILINASAKYDFAPWLNVQVRGNVDRANDTYEQDLYAGTIGVLSQPNGQFLYTNQTLTSKYGDVLVNFSPAAFSGFKLDGLVGSSITDVNTIGSTLGPDINGNYTAPGLFIPNIFTGQNLVAANGGTAGSNDLALPNNHNQIQSIFANVNLSYKEWAYLTLTGRNDWSSNLAFTPNESYFYPSVGLSVILSQLLKLPSAINYLKVRGTYAQVGNTVPNYVTNPLAHFGTAGAVVLNSVAPFPTLKPEKTKSTELGADFRLLDNRLTASFTWYKSNTLNQFIQVTPSATTTFSKGYVNAGNIQNEGIEFMLGYDVVRASHFTWNTAFNGSTNQNKVIDVDAKDGINQFIITPNFNNSYESILSKGGSYGDIYGVTLQKNAQGQIMIGSGGLPLTNNGFNLIGNPNPKFQLGWSNTLTYKNLTFSFLIDGKFGGNVLSMTQAMLDQYGVSEVTGQARDAGAVKINGVGPNGIAVTTINPQTWYTTIGGRAGITGEYMYSATVVRLREAALGYTFPLKSTIVKNLRLSVTGRNLLYFSKKAPYDPELTMSTGNGLSGVDVFSQPATRNLGVNLNVTF